MDKIDKFIKENIKPLEWAYSDRDGHTAEAGMLDYAVFQYPNSDNWTSVVVVNGKQPFDGNYKSYASIELAKSACEADRIERIRGLFRGGEDEIIQS